MGAVVTSCRPPVRAGRASRPALRRWRRPVSAVVAVVVVAGAAIGVSLGLSSSPPVLSQKAQSGWAASAYSLEARYVAAAWCTPLTSGTLGVTPSWPAKLATRTAVPSLVDGPPGGQIPHRATSVNADMSDARAILPGGGQSWHVTPRFCVYQSEYPRLVTSGGLGQVSYPPLPKRIKSMNDVFDRFRPYLGPVTGVVVPLLIEVSYSMSIGSEPSENFHLYWYAVLSMVPSGHSYGLELSTWSAGGHLADVGVLTDAPPGPVFVHPNPPGSGP